MSTSRSLMECNKEEAIRAKEIAEKKMESKDFAAARKIGLKAQQLYPDLENISQMLMVCDVHCSAAQKLFGSEMDWYGILQIDQKADELTIKKQYRKCALQLHPDKNKFSGAEAAFKLIGEAQRILLDREKRNMHDLKRRASLNKTAVQYRPPARASWTSNVSTNRSNLAGMNFQNNRPQQQPTQPKNAQSTFWTTCSFCKKQYLYYRDTLHKSVACQDCKKFFVAYETIAPQTTSSYQQAKPQCFSKVEVRSQGNGTVEKSKSKSFQKGGQKAGCASGIGSEKVNRKRDRKRVVEASESSNTENSTDSEEDIVIDKDAVHQGYFRDGQPRRSSRSKQKVSYKENMSDDDDDDIPISKREKRSGSSCATEEGNEDASKEEESKMDSQTEPASKTKAHVENLKRTKSESFGDSLKVQEEKTMNVPEYNKVNDNSQSDTHQGDPKVINLEGEHMPGPTEFEVPDPEFHNFDAKKSLEKFQIGQVWSLYSDEDSLPKYYGQIKKIDSSKSELKILVAWLECSELPEGSIEWRDEEMPISCGRFKVKRSPIQDYDSTLSFSHQVIVFQAGKTEYDIYPRKGEVWALYRNWTPDMLTSGLETCEYDIVEVCKEDNLQRKVFVLERVDGFNAVFKFKMEGGSAEIMSIPHEELLRFSHQVPSFRLTDEKGGSLAGCWEIDPAAMPVRYFSKS